MTAVRVGNLARSLAFYQEVLGCAVAERPGPDLATVDLFGYPVLLAGPDAGDPRPHLHDVHEVFEGQATLHAFHANLDRLAADLEARGARDLERVERPWGDRLLAVPDPDGHRVAFWTEVARSPEEIVALYAEGPAALERALAGLDGAALDLARAPGAWTIRQIVHHVADSDATTLSRVKMALAEPGRAFVGNAYSQDVWAEALRYAERPIEPSVALFTAIRAHILQIVRLLPDALDRATVGPEGHAMTVGRSLEMLACHALEHVEEIAETRRIHGV